MSFRDLDDFLVVRDIELPIAGKVYRFPGSISARSGLLLQRILGRAEEAKASLQDGTMSPTALAAEVLTDVDEEQLRAEILGDGERLMAEAGLSTAHVTHVFRTLMTWHMAGPEAAEAAWEHSGEAPAPNRATRRASKGSASTTTRRASTSGTTTRAPAKGRARPGASSSSTSA